MIKKNNGGTYKEDQFYLWLISTLPFKDVQIFREFVGSHEKASVGENYSLFKFENKLVDAAEGRGTHNLCFRTEYILESYTLRAIEIC